MYLTPGWHLPPWQLFPLRIPHCPLWWPSGGGSRGSRRSSGRPDRSQRIRGGEPSMYVENWCNSSQSSSIRPYCSRSRMHNSVLVIFLFGNISLTSQCDFDMAKWRGVYSVWKVTCCDNKKISVLQIYVYILWSTVTSKTYYTQP